MVNLRFAYMILAGLLVFINGWAQQGKISFERLTTEEGLSNNMVRCIMQDSVGYLWIGTNDGLNRYDGYDFRVYNNIPGDTNSLVDNSIYTIFENSPGDLWIGTTMGISRMNTIEESFRNYTHSEEKTNSLSGSQVRTILLDHEDYIWVGTQVGGLNRYDPGTDEFKHYLDQGSSINCLFEDHEGNLWAGGIYGELFFVSRDRKEIFRYYNSLAEQVQIKENELWFIREDKNYGLIIGMAAGLFRFDKATGEFRTFLDDFENLGSYRDNEFHSMLRDPEGILWFGTYGRGLYRYDPSARTTRNFQIEPGNPNSLSNNDVNRVFRDKSGVTWICTQDGLDKIDPARGLFTHFQNIPGQTNSLSLNFVTCFGEDRNGYLWIGTFGGGINKFDRENNRFTHYKKEENRNSLIHDAVRAIILDHNGYLWIATLYGLDKFDPVRETFAHYRHDPEDTNSLSGNDLLSVIEDQFGMIWIGTYGDGLNRLNPHTGKFTRYLAHDSLVHGLKSDFVRTIMEDSRGSLWIGCVENGGLYRFDPMAERFTAYRHSASDSLSLSHNNINSIHEDSRGNLWIASWNGLNLMDRGAGTFFHIGTAEGLPHDKIVQVLSDDDGQLWISSHRGISRLTFHNRGDYHIINYSLSNGLQGDEFSINSSFKTRNGELLFGGTNGFNSFYPANIPVNEFIPPVVITDFQIYNRSIQANREYRGNVKYLAGKDSIPLIRLNYLDKVITFGFSALSYSLPDKNRYAYQMEGMDMDWVETSARRRYASYTNLDPGEYIFRIRASNSDGIWNQTGTAVRVIVDPPFWQTWWAFLVYGFMTVLTMLLIRRMLVYRMQLRNQVVLERMEREKVEEINQMKLSFFTNVSHEFKTPLTLVTGPLDELLGNPGNLDEKSRNHLLLMHRNANRLHRLINQLIDFRRVEKGSLELRVQQGDLVAIVTDIKEAFNEFAEKHRMDYRLISNRRSVMAWYDPDKIEKIFYNLLSNAFKYTNDGGRILVRLHFEINRDRSLNRTGLKSRIRSRDENPELPVDDHVIISVEDSGIGISPERLPKIFDRFYKIEKSERLKRTLEQEGSGIGLSLTKSLIEMHRGSISAESQEGRGSMFIIRLPLGRDHFSADQVDESGSRGAESMSYELSSFLQSELNEELEPVPVGDSAGELDKDTPLILIVEDNADLRTFIRYSFEPVYRIREAENGREGYEKALEEIPDVVVSDIMMPEMDGFELCKKLKEDERTSHIPIVMLTARDSVDDRITGYETGADAYIPKPFNIKLLSVRIQTLISSRQKLRESLYRKIILEPSETFVESADEKFLSRVMQITEEHMSDPEFNVIAFGDLINMSRMQLYRKLKSLTNLSANEFIRIIRLKRAAQLLGQDAMTISEITYEVGFNDPKYFSKCFHKQYGMTPSQYAASHGKARATSEL
jgi:signal transduction histidine kinase/ligand-binding sensor domain-containing protein/DNA-binding response OmpR family regulator